MKIVWLQLAQRDLRSISAYYESAASKELADRLMQRIVHCASRLIENPYIGGPSESIDGVHEIQVPRLPYLIPYRVVADRVEILRVFHESQDRPSSWQAK